MEFPFLFGGTFIEACRYPTSRGGTRGFPFLFGGTFIEAALSPVLDEVAGDFPSFSEGLSLRPKPRRGFPQRRLQFPFLFGGTFIEAVTR